MHHIPKVRGGCLFESQDTSLQKISLLLSAVVLPNRLKNDKYEYTISLTLSLSLAVYYLFNLQAPADSVSIAPFLLDSNRHKISKHRKKTLKLQNYKVKVTLCTVA